MSKKLALAAGYSVLHNTKPADDVKRNGHHHHTECGVCLPGSVEIECARGRRSSMATGVPCANASAGGSFSMSLKTLASRSSCAPLFACERASCSAGVSSSDALAASPFSFFAALGLLVYELAGLVVCSDGADS